MPQEKLAIGRIGSPHGVHGDLRVTSYSGEFGHLLRLASVELSAPDSGRSLRLKVLKAEEAKGGLIMVFEGYESPEKARELTGMDIVVPRAKAAPLAKNEWYVTDLVGLAFRGPDGAELATVKGFVEGGSDLLLEASLPSGGSTLVPFRKEYIGDIHVEEGWLELLTPWILE